MGREQQKARRDHEGEIMEPIKVYIVTRQDFDTGYSIFCGVFFKRALAEDWINSRGYGEYRIETWQEQEDGTALEVYEI